MLDRFPAVSHPLTILAVCILYPPFLSLADGKALVFRARQEASQFWYNYGHEMPVSALAKRMADIAQLSTQYVGSRPMGVAMILVGMEMDDDGVCGFA